MPAPRFRITVPPTDPVQLTITTNTADCSTSDTVLDIFDAAGVQLDDGPTDDDINYPADRCSRAMTNVWPGDYTVCVREFGNDAAIAGITVSSAWTTITPVGLAGTCNAGELCALGLQCVHWVGMTDRICDSVPTDEAGDRTNPKPVLFPISEAFMLFGGEEDCYSFPLGDAATFSFTTPGTSGDLVLELWDGTGTLARHQDAGAAGYPETLTQANLAAPTVAGTYVLCVYEFSDYSTMTNTLSGTSP
ncbi:MAG: PPC domain-containing protein [Deltaproteobacteria bacterium]|nr:PPC domain-containing protein [Deltaproteobacteria bacterium]